MSQLDVNTNVRNNVILYKFERDTYFRNMKIFGIGQIFGWSILSLYTYKPSFWDIFYTDIKLKEYWFNNMFRLSMFLFSIFTGKNHVFYYVYNLYLYLQKIEKIDFIFFGIDIFILQGLSCFFSFMLRVVVASSTSF